MLYNVSNLVRRAGLGRQTHSGVLLASRQGIAEHLQQARWRRADRAREADARNTAQLPRRMC